MKLAISGPTASGKTYHAKNIAREFQLDYIAGSDILRRIAKVNSNKEPHFWINKGGLALTKRRKTDPTLDIRTDEEILKVIETSDSLILDSSIIPWLYKGSDLIKIYLYADINSRMGMAYKSEQDKLFNKDILRRKILQKDKDTAETFKKLYGVNINKVSIFDINFDISSLYKNPVNASILLCSKIERFCTKKAIFQETVKKP